MKKISLMAFISILALTSCSNNILTKYNAYENAVDYTAISSTGAAFIDIHTINVDWVKGTVHIHSTTEYEHITMFEKSKEIYQDEFRAHYSHKYNILDIKYCKSNISIPSSINKTLEIYVPENINLNLININNVSSNVLIDDIVCDNLKINNVSGDVTLSSIEGSSIDYSGVSGQLNASITDKTNKFTINQVSGTTVLSMPIDSKGFLVNFGSVSGKINLDYEVKVQDNIYTYLDGNNLLIDFNSVSGNLLISPRKK